jgi:Fe-S-cluster containining protein
MGCSYCCGLHITTSRLEAELARLYILDAFSPADREEAAGKIGRDQALYLRQEELESLKNDPASLERRLDAYLQRQITCPFLSDAGACTIYPARPFACRSLVVISHPDDCRRHKGTQLKPYNINDYVLAAIANLSRKVFGENVGERHFPQWFTEGFDNSL